MTEAAFVTLDEAKAAQEKTEPPRPLTREIPPGEPFPIDALGPVLGSAAAGIHDRVQAPLGICGQSLAAFATVAAQGHADVKLPTGQIRPLSSFFVSIAETGERKTAVDSEAAWPVRKREQALREGYDEAKLTARNERDAWEKQRSLILNDKKSFPDAKSRAVALDAVGPEPEDPLSPILTAPEPTFEGLCKMFPNSLPSVGLFASEAGQFIGGFGMSMENRLRTAAGFSALWDGDPIKRVRAGDGVLVLPGRRLAMHLMAQPGVAAQMLGDRLLADQGLLSRVLVSAPEPASGTRLHREPRPESEAAIKRYGARILATLEAPLPMTEGKRNELDPRSIALSPQATAVWWGLADHIERQLGDGAPLAPIRGLANKLAEHAARLATVIALIEDIECGEITAPHIEAGIELAQHYASEALRLFEMGHLDPDLKLAQKLLGWLHGEWDKDHVSLPNIYQLGPNAIRDKRRAQEIVDLLEDHGWLIKVEGGAEIDGLRRRHVWQVVKS